YFGYQLAEGGWNAAVVDITAAHGIVGGIGPKAVELLSDLVRPAAIEHIGAGDAAYEVEVGWTDALLITGSVLGEPAWMCMVPVERASYAYEVASGSAEALGGRPVGRYAVESLRHQARSAAWGLDLSVCETPVEAGCGDLVKAGEHQKFRGCDALAAQGSKRVWRRLVSLAVEDPETLMWGDEPLFRDAVMVGRVTSAAYGYEQSRCLGMAVIERVDAPVDAAYIEEGCFEVEVGGRRYAATVCLVGVPTGVSGVLL
ncbi:MAG: glycine cleavage T C-terminal barrel domain-containing protein, partial [Acidimicrobiales bacterium]